MTSPARQPLRDALIAGGISIVIVAAVGALGTKLNTTFETVKNGFN